MGWFMMNRRQMLMVFSAFMALPPLVGGLPRVAGAQANLREEDRILGDPDAPLTIIEYASLTCPHCANFHLDVLPQVKEEWIDSGRASLVYRHFPLDNVALSAALVAEAMPSDRAFFGFLNVLFDTQ